MSTLMRIGSREPLKTCTAEMYKIRSREANMIGSFAFRYKKSDNLIRMIYSNAMENLMYHCDKTPKRITIVAYTEDCPNGYRISVHKDDFQKYLSRRFKWL